MAQKETMSPLEQHCYTATAVAARPSQGLTGTVSLSKQFTAIEPSWEIESH